MGPGKSAGFGYQERRQRHQDKDIMSFPIEVIKTKQKKLVLVSATSLRQYCY